MITSIMEIVGFGLITDGEAYQVDNSSRRDAGTGTLLLEAPEFNVWLKRSRYSMFCHKIPGFGKTILSSIANSHQEKFGDEPSVRVYLFCEYRQRFFLENGLQLNRTEEAENLLFLATQPERDSEQVVMRVMDEWTIDAGVIVKLYYQGP